MDNILTKIIKMMMICIVATLALSFGVFYNDVRNSRTVTGEEDSLTGQRIGVMCGWEADYFLSERDDITIKRYNQMADLFMALNYKQVDAIAVDTIINSYCGKSISNIKIVGDSLDSYYYTFYMKKGNEIGKQMNEFIEFYTKTDEYKEYAEKAVNIEWIDSDDYTPETGTGDVVKFGYVADFYPNVFVDANGNPRGPEVEFLIRFANYYNYKIEWIEVPSSAYDLGVRNGKADLVSCASADYYRQDINYKGSVIDLTEGFLKSDLCLVVPDGDMKIDNGFVFDTN